MPQPLGNDIREEIKRVETLIDEMKNPIKRAAKDVLAIEKLTLQLREHTVRLRELERNLNNCEHTS